MKTIHELLQECDALKARLSALRPLPVEALKKIEGAFAIEYTYESNRIEGNTLTLQETELVVNEGVTIAGKSMPHPEQFVPDTLENIARYLKEDLCIGGWDGGRLGAYFILRYCGQDAHNYAAFMGIPREEWDGWANADSAIVHPDYRGNGLQRKLLEVALTLLRPGIVGIGATVSPENQYSLNNALASGFEIVCRREMYGGYDRYLLAKTLK